MEAKRRLLIKVGRGREPIGPESEGVRGIVDRWVGSREGGMAR